MPRILLVLTIVIGGLYSAYWFVGRAILARGLDAVIAEADAGPAEVAHAGIAIRGFPSRFDVTFTEPRIQAAGRGWTAAFFQALMLSYQPGQFILVWPDQQTATWGGQDHDVTTERMRASLSVGLTPDANLKAATLETGASSVSGTDGAAVGWSRLLMAIRDAAVSEPGHPYDLFAEASGLSVPGSDAPLSVRFDGTGMFDAAIGRNVMTAPPRLTVLAIRDLTVRGNGLIVTMTGALSVDGAGRLQGETELHLPNVGAAVDLAGVLLPLDAGRAANLRQALATVAADDGSVTLPLSFEAGAARVAGVPLGIVPPLW